MKMHIINAIVYIHTYVYNYSNFIYNYNWI